MVKLYMTTPVIVKAVKWEGNNIEEVKDVCPEAYIHFEVDFTIITIPVNNIKLVVPENCYVLSFSNGNYKIMDEEEFNSSFTTLM